MAELLGQVVGPGKQRRGRRLTVDQELHALEQHAVGERQVDLVGRHVLFERLHGRIVAAGLVADRDRHAGEVLGPLHRRIGRHEHAGGRDRIGLGIELAVAGGRRHADGPVAGAAHIGRAAFLERLEGADLVALVMVRAVARLDQFPKFVVEARVLEVALLLGDPFLQAEMRLDDEFFFCHGALLRGAAIPR